MKLKSLEVDTSIELKTTHLFRECSGKMSAMLINRFGINELENIMDVVQESFETALRQWRYKGMPENPEAWLMTVAKNKMINVLKRQNHLQQTAFVEFGDIAIATDEAERTDSQLQLLMHICGAPLSSKSKVIFTLYVLSGFGVAEIANALLMNAAAVKKNIFRTKQLLKGSKLSFDGFSRLQLIENIADLHTVLYLLFNEGYKTTRAKSGLNLDMCYEAIRITQIILKKIGTHGTTNALLALMFFNVARFPARISSNLIWISLAEQDRTLWNQTCINEANYHLNCSRESTTVSKYHIEATIASIHCFAKDFPTTDWVKIIRLYDHLEIIEGKSSLLTLNKIIVLSYHAPTQQLVEDLATLELDLKSKKPFLFYLTKAHVHALLNEPETSKQNYLLALSHTRANIDKRYILHKIGTLV